MQVGKTIGLKDKEIGHFATIEIEWTELWIIGPPADKP